MEDQLLPRHHRLITLRRRLHRPPQTACHGQCTPVIPRFSFGPAEVKSQRKMSNGNAEVGIIMGSTVGLGHDEGARPTCSTNWVSPTRPRSSPPTAPQAALRVRRVGAKARGLKVIIAGAGGAAHLPGMTASLTPLPVLGVPVTRKALSGQDSLLSIVQMPAGVPVGTLAIGEAGATNAGILAAQILALEDRRARASGSTPMARSAQTATFPRRRRTVSCASTACRRCRPAPPSASWQRPARPHAGAGRRAARASRRRIYCDESGPAFDVAAHDDRGAFDDAPRSRPSPASTPSPTSSRTCRSRRPRPRARACRCGPGAKALAVSQDRLTEKTLHRRRSAFPSHRFRAVAGAEDSPPRSPPSARRPS